MRALFLLFLGCRTLSPGATADEPCSLQTEGFGPAGTVEVNADVIASGLTVPWSLVFLPSGKLMVAERPGRVKVLSGNTVVTLQVATGSEQGLLGMVLHPEFASNRWFYIYFSTANENRVERWHLADDDGSATVDRSITGGILTSSNHVGGRMRFGPDGMLYISTGDAQQPDRAQGAGLNGKILRLQDDGSIPEGQTDAVFISGVRNSEGFDWLDDGRMVVADHGPSGELNGRKGYDEVSIAKAGDNLGWPKVTGCDQGTGMQAPIIAWQEAQPPGGLAIYRTGSISDWQGSIMLASLGGQHLHRIVLNGDLVASHEVYFLNAYGRLRDAVIGPDNELYVTTSNCDGRGACPSDKDKVLKISRARR